MNTYFSILIFFAIQICCTANSMLIQPKVTNSKFGIYAEAGGPGGFGSIGITFRAFNQQKNTFSLKTGIGTVKFFDFNRKFRPDIILPISILYATETKIPFEFSVGQIFSGMTYFSQTHTTPIRKWDHHTFIGAGIRIFNFPHIGIQMKASIFAIAEFHERILPTGAISITYNVKQKTK